MKKMSLVVMPVILIMIGVVSCNQPAQAPVTDSKGDQNKAVVDKFLTALRSGDMKTVGDQLADNFMSYGPSIKDSSNRAQFIDLWSKRWEAELQSVTYGRYGNVAVTIDSADWVNEWGRIDATYKNGLPPIKFDYHGAFRMENGKIAMSAVFYNVADILEQQGYKFVPSDSKDQPK